eukprot:UN27848
MIKCKSGVKGIVRFQGPVLYFKDIRVGIEVAPDFQGDCNGTCDGKRYFKVKKKRGLFIQFDSISHVYRRREDGKMEKIRFDITRRTKRSASPGLRSSQFYDQTPDNGVKRQPSRTPDPAKNPFRDAISASYASMSHSVSKSHEPSTSRDSLSLSRGSSLKRKRRRRRIKNKKKDKKERNLLRVESEAWEEQDLKAMENRIQKCIRKIKGRKFKYPTTEIRR